MANTKIAQRRPETLDMTIFQMTSAAGATETFAMPAGTRVYDAHVIFTSATARTGVGYQYVQATGVLTLSGLTAADAGFVVVIHE